jgi:hypothetical protein
MLHKIATTQFLTITRINSFESTCQEERGCMVENIAKHNHKGKLVDSMQICHKLTTNNLCRMLFHTCYETSKEFIGIDFDEIFKFVAKLI